jgi:hypothetical protein
MYEKLTLGDSIFSMKIRAVKPRETQQMSLRFDKDLVDWIDSETEKQSKALGRFISRQKMITAILESARRPENKGFVVEIE